jgi:hypothetical protein
MEYQVTITVSEHGYDPAAADRLLDTFLTADADAGPAVSQDVDAGTLTVAFSVHGDEALVIPTKAVQMFADMSRAAGLPLTEVLGVHIDAVSPQTLQAA